MEKRLIWLKAFFKFVFNQFGKKHASAMAAELTLNNMLALVPLMTVVVSVMAIFPAFDNLNDKVQTLIFDNLLPDTGLAVQEHLNAYVAKSKNLSAIGLGFLIVTSLMLMRSIDRSINMVWESHNQRRGVQKWLAYWAMLTMAPILIAASLFVSSYFAALPLFDKVNSLLSIGLPFILITFAFTALYMFTPYHSVKFRKALVAATFTALLFEVAKYAFAIFVTKFSTYEVIYGAITAIPLFFVWVYLSWLIVLLGAIICFALHRFEIKREKPEHEFISILKLTEFFTQAQAGESSVTIAQLTNQFPYLHERTLRQYVEQLMDLNFIVKLEDEQYCLKLNGKELTIAEIYRRGDWRLPNNQEFADQQNDYIGELIGKANLGLDGVLARHLHDLTPKDL